MTVTRTVKDVVVTTVIAAAITESRPGAIRNAAVLRSVQLGDGAVLPVVVALGPVVAVLLDPGPVVSVPVACARAPAVANVGPKEATVGRRAVASHRVAGRVTPDPARGGFVTVPIGSKIGTVTRPVFPTGGSPATNVRRRGAATRHPQAVRIVSSAPFQLCNRRLPLPHRPRTI